MSRMRALIQGAGVTAFLGLALPAGAANYVFGTDGTPLLCVPEQDVPEHQKGLTASALNLTIVPPGANFRHVVIVHYEAPEIRVAIPGFHFRADYADDDPPNIIAASVSLMSDAAMKHPPGAAAGPDVGRIWDRNGACKDALIAQVPGSSTWLVRCRQDTFGHILFDRLPGTEPRPEDLYTSVLATCRYQHIRFGPHAGSKFERCTRRLNVSGLRLDYNVEIENANLIPQIDAFLRTKVDGWKRNCEM